MKMIEKIKNATLYGIPNSQNLYPFWVIEKQNKDRLYELISKKINTGTLSKPESLELYSLKIKVWRHSNV